LPELFIKPPVFKIHHVKILPTNMIITGAIANSLGVTRGAARGTKMRQKERLKRAASNYNSAVKIATFR
jgi:hypothetical protein